jgi:hypothetical protein
MEVQRSMKHLSHIGAGAHSEVFTVYEGQGDSWEKIVLKIVSLSVAST